MSEIIHPSPSNYRGNIPRAVPFDDSECVKCWEKTLLWHRENPVEFARRVGLDNAGKSYKYPSGTALCFECGQGIIEEMRRHYLSTVHLRNSDELIYPSSREEYLQKSFNNECDLCLKKLRRDQINIDHDHSSKVIRGILCTFCNTHLVSDDALKESIFRGDDMSDQEVLDYLQAQEMLVKSFPEEFNSGEGNADQSPFDFPLGRIEIVNVSRNGSGRLILVFRNPDDKKKYIFSADAWCAYVDP